MHFGNRLTLEYDIIQSNAENFRSVESTALHQVRLQSLLAAWIKMLKKDAAHSTLGFPTLLAYVCDLKYEDNSCRFSALRGKDRLRVGALREACSQIGISLCIATLVRTDSVSCTHHHENQDQLRQSDAQEERSIKVTKITDDNGKVSVFTVTRATLFRTRLSTIIQARKILQTITAVLRKHGNS